MTDAECNSGQEAHVISLLLEEYRTLREEQISKLVSQGNLLGYVGAGVALIAGLSSGVRLVISLVFLSVLAAAYYLRNIQNVLRLSRQLEELERRINRLAVGAYGSNTPVLTWITQIRNAPPGVYDHMIKRGF